MARINQKQGSEISALWEAADSGQLGSAMETFVKRSVELVENAPETFRVRKDIDGYLATLRYVVDLHVYRSRSHHG